MPLNLTEFKNIKHNNLKSTTVKMMRAKRRALLLKATIQSSEVIISLAWFRKIPKKATKHVQITQLLVTIHPEAVTSSKNQ
jgi:hypothetical protein